MTWSVANLALFAQAAAKNAGGAGASPTGPTPGQWVMIVVGMIAALLFLVFLFVFFSFIRLWIQALLTRADISIFNLIGMKLRNVDYGMIVRQKIALVQAGVKVTTEDLESHFLARGNVPKTATAVIAAHKAGLDLPWRTAAAIDLAGRDVLEAVRTSVNPKVIDCPDPAKGKQFLDAVCKNGIQLLAKARVTVRTKLDRLVGGATEETIIARVGQGIVKAIGSAHDHKEVLANPGLISEEVLNSGLDAQTAFEIVSIDIANLEPGENIGAKLAGDQAASDLRVAQAEAEKRRAAAVAREQEMRALVEENRAKVVEAEAQVPQAISEAFRNGHMGVMDFYNMKNVMSDTTMRNNIATMTGGSDSGTNRN
ncbi:SigmaW regulon antibacterial [Urbifossiella limnaea]|uniref:Flotillin-like protein FloA n=2 Tax=Urbifossiella limnaea TaxID=2528023 RepID=A0A517Y3A2_9BACT|nr:flotillin-like protein FloA [Urbifossiella limnaea]QDU24283.1 SigmaW regulon antibacterial [Urbifossiella limnaea]